MYQTLSTSDAVGILTGDKHAAWSVAGACAIVEYLEQTEEETGERIEFDRTAIRCDFSEYSSAKEAAVNYGWDDATDDATEEAALRWLRDRTVVLVFDGYDASGVIVGSF